MHQKNKVSSILKMKKILFLLPLICQLACKKTDDVKESIIGQWQVDGFVANENAISKNAETNLYLSFENDKSLELSMEVNSCQGKFQIQESTLSIEELSCTKACCDSEFSIELGTLIPTVNTYELSNGVLNLTGDQGLKIRLIKP